MENDKTMKILHVITSLATGGAEHLMVDLLPLLREFGNEVELAVFDGTKTAFYRQLEAEGIKIHAFAEGGSVYSIKHIWKLKKLMKGFDIVHTHNTACQLFAAIGKPKGVKLVTTEHNTDNRRRHIPFLKFVDLWMYHRYDKIICISDQAETNLREYLYPKESKSKICTIYNGIDVHKFLQAEPVAEWKRDFAGKRLVVMVAAFRAQKDQKTLIDAFAHLTNEYELLLVGGGELLDDVKQYAATKDYCDRVHFMGLRTDIPNVLKTADVVVMSTHYEGLSLSNVEGMASGNPFVASDVDGIREVTKGYGVLFLHEDDKALAEVIKRLCTDNGYREEVVSKCRERALQYDISRMAEGYFEAYSELL